MGNLELLARHVHEAPVEWWYGGIYEGKPQWFTDIEPGECELFSKKMILAERDRLSGKPKEWVNDWARFRAQDGDGYWIEFDSEPSIAGRDWGLISNTQNLYVIKPGEIIGDWRDTLEEREMCDHEPGLEPRKEQVEWDGEGLPPLGVKLDGVKTISSTEGIEAWWGKPYWLVVGHHINGNTFFVEGIKSGVIQQFRVTGDKPQYRPIKSERQKVVEAMVKVMSAGSPPDVYTHYAEALLDSNLFDIKMRGEE